MPRGIKRTAPVDVSRRECKQSASAACNGATKLSEYYRDSLDSRLMIDEESPTRNAVGYHLVDHEYGVTPKNQIIHGDPVEPPRSTHAVKRRLNMNDDDDVDVDVKPPPQLADYKDFKAPKSKRTTKGQGTNWKKYSERNSRYDTSLSLLTKKFVHLLKTSPNGVINLNVASTKLDVQKRRIYDITNVLEGIGILEKKSKNNIQWKLDNSKTNEKRRLTDQISFLKAKEEELDYAIATADKDYKHISENNRYAYITYADLKGLSEFKDQTVVPLKAPPSTKITVPSISEGHCIEFQTQHGEIEVFLCPKLEPSPPPTPPVVKETIRDALHAMKAVLPRKSSNVLKTKNNHYTISPLDSSKLSPVLKHALERNVTLLSAQRDLTNYFSGPSESTLSSNKNKSSSLSNSNSVSNSGIKTEPCTTSEDIATTSESCVCTETKTDKVSSFSITLTGVKLEANDNEDQKDIKLKNALISHIDDFGTSHCQFQTEDQHNLDTSSFDDSFNGFLPVDLPFNEGDFSFGLGGEEGLTDLYEF